MKTCPTCKKQYADQSTICPDDSDMLETDLGSLIGTTLDSKYKIEAILGQGGMGAVYRARHILLGDRVAIKVLRQHLCNDPEYRRRFLREGRAARIFKHSNAVTVYDLHTTSDGMIYMVQEYIEGLTLRAEFESRGKFTPVESIALLEPVANALNAAHAMGVIHRDLKPENIMISRTSDGQILVKLLDLGLAKIIYAPGIGQSGSTSMTVVKSMTVVGQTLGTPFYMSPEQWGVLPKDGNPDIDKRTDVYSLGIIFYELIAGHRPFKSGTYQELAYAHISAEPIPLHKASPNVSESFSQVILRALAKDRSQRQSSCEELIEELCWALNKNQKHSELKAGASLYTTINQVAEQEVDLEAETPQMDKAHEIFVSLAPKEPVTDHFNQAEQIPKNEISQQSGVVSINKPSKKMPIQVISTLAILLFIVGGAIDWQKFFREVSFSQPVISTEHKIGRTITYWIVAQKDPERHPDSKPFRLSGEVIFEKGYQVRLNLSSPESGYLYILNEGPSTENGLPQYNVIFPKPTMNSSSALIAANEQIQVPGQSWLVFDAEEGTEKFWLIWTAKSIPELEAVKSVVNPQDKGVISKPEQIRSVQDYISRYTVSKPQIERDEDKKVTIVKTGDEVLVNLLRLEHH
jgi:eukaryotic-like serine/threonine-protein kinase